MRWCQSDEASGVCDQHISNVEFLRLNSFSRYVWSNRPLFIILIQYYSLSLTLHCRIVIVTLWAKQRGGFRVGIIHISNDIYISMDRANRWTTELNRLIRIVRSTIRRRSNVCKIRKKIRGNRTCTHRHMRALYDVDETKEKIHFDDIIMSCYDLLCCGQWPLWFLISNFFLIFPRLFFSIFQ